MKTIKILLFLAIVFTLFTSCQNEYEDNIVINTEIVSSHIAKHTHFALNSCISKEGNDYGIMLFGDSMLNYPSSHIMSFLSSSTNTFQGLGNSYYPINNNFINSKGSFLRTNNGALLLNVNQQNDVLGTPAWAGVLGYINGINQNISFVTEGVFPTGVTTKIFILTETLNTGTYDIQTTTDNGYTWLNVLTNQTTHSNNRGMKVHLFNDTSKTTSVGYRVIWRSGQVMCLDPLFLKKGGNNIYHITVGSGGADFKLQVSIPKERVRFLIDQANIKMVTSSHRYEIETTEEFSYYQNLMDEWWEGKNIDVLYFAQPPQINDNELSDKLKRDVNTEIKHKADEKGYLFFDMYKELGGKQGVIDNQWGEEDPVHLSQEAYSYLKPKLLTYLEFK